ncbi:flagellar filament capping protein FliD [Angustibacter sp. McL0619]|uniref:flagellar filament capping protein FliD n=1 Tax=Angustibacter sp. McL0619 TaxID=3415676 RepID=UPI003CF5EB43
MATSVDGLISGLDTTTIISQLMTLNAAPQTRLKTSLGSQQVAVTALQTVNSKMSSLQTAAELLQKSTTWTAASASSGSSAVTATASAGALAGTSTFSVSKLATAQSVVSGTTYSSLTDTSSFSDTGFEIHRGSTTVAITPADGSMQSLVSAINSTSGSGLQAAAVQVSPGQYRLQLTATDTGAKNAFSLTATGGGAIAGTGFDQVRSAQDAVLHVGDANAGFDITSSSNTVEGVMPGVTVKLNSLATDVSVSVQPNQQSMSDAVKAMVDAANATLASISSVSSSGVAASDGTRSGAGPLAGDSLMRQLTSRILSSVSAGVGGKSLSSVGISVTKDGTLSFDSTKFSTALTADPAGTKAMFTTATVAGTGFADGVQTLAQGAASSGGSLASAITGRQSSIKDLTDRIADWDVRLALRQTALQKQYSALEVSLGKLKNQSTWLAGQLSSLSSNSGSD